MSCPNIITIGDDKRLNNARRTLQEIRKQQRNQLIRSQVSSYEKFDGTRKHLVRTSGDQLQQNKDPSNFDIDILYFSIPDNVNIPSQNGQQSGFKENGTPTKRKTSYETIWNIYRFNCQKCGQNRRIEFQNNADIKNTTKRNSSKFTRSSQLRQFKEIRCQCGSSWFNETVCRCSGTEASAHKQSEISSVQLPRSNQFKKTECRCQTEDTAQKQSREMLVRASRSSEFEIIEYMIVETEVDSEKHANKSTVQPRSYGNSTSEKVSRTLRKSHKQNASNGVQEDEHREIYVKMIDKEQQIQKAQNKLKKKSIQPVQSPSQILISESGYQSGTIETIERNIKEQQVVKQNQENENKSKKSSIKIIEKKQQMQKAQNKVERNSIQPVQSSSLIHGKESGYQSDKIKTIENNIQEQVVNQNQEEENKSEKCCVKIIEKQQQMQKAQNKVEKESIQRVQSPSVILVKESGYQCCKIEAIERDIQEQQVVKQTEENENKSEEYFLKIIEKEQQMQEAQNKVEKNSIQSVQSSSLVLVKKSEYQSGKIEIIERNIQEQQVAKQDQEDENKSKKCTSEAKRLISLINQMECQSYETPEKQKVLKENQETHTHQMNQTNKLSISPTQIENITSLNYMLTQNPIEATEYNNIVKEPTTHIATKYISKKNGKEYENNFYTINQGNNSLIKNSTKLGNITQVYTVTTKSQSIQMKPTYCSTQACTPCTCREQETQTSQKAKKGDYRSVSDEIVNQRTGSQSSLQNNLCCSRTNTQNQEPNSRKGKECTSSNYSACSSPNKIQLQQKLAKDDKYVQIIIKRPKQQMEIKPTKITKEESTECDINQQKQLQKEKRVEENEEEFEEEYEEEIWQADPEDPEKCPACRKSYSDTFLQEPPENDDFYMALFRQTQKGCLIPTIIDKCRNSPSVISQMLQKVNHGQYPANLESDTFLMNETHGELGDPKYHYLMTDIDTYADETDPEQPADIPGQPLSRRLSEQYQDKLEEPIHKKQSPLSNKESPSSIKEPESPPSTTRNEERPENRGERQASMVSFTRTSTDSVDRNHANAMEATIQEFRQKIMDESKASTDQEKKTSMLSSVIKEEKKKSLLKKSTGSLDTVSKTRSNSSQSSDDAENRPPSAKGRRKCCGFLKRKHNKDKDGKSTSKKTAISKTKRSVESIENVSDDGTSYKFDNKSMSHISNVYRRRRSSPIEHPVLEEKKKNELSAIV